MSSVDVPGTAMCRPYYLSTVIPLNALRYSKSRLRKEEGFVRDETAPSHSQRPAHPTGPTQVRPDHINIIM